MDWYRRNPYLFVIVAATMGLVIFGLFSLYSATIHQSGGSGPSPFTRQIVWLAIGALVFAGIFVSSSDVLSRVSFIVYGAAVILLLLVLVTGTGRAGRWIGVGGFRFQPSELAKVATVMALAGWAKTERIWESPVKRLTGILLTVFIPLVLVARQPDVGTASVFLAVGIGVAVWAGLGQGVLLLAVIPVIGLFAGFYPLILIGFLLLLIGWLAFDKKRRRQITVILLIGAAFGLSAPALWMRLPAYQQDRIRIFLGVASDPRGAAYQAIQSKIAVGSGGVWGKGYLEGTQTHLRFLPEQHTDFIFSVLGEEFGFIGVAVVLGLFWVLISRMIQLALIVRDRYAAVLAMGCASILAFQVLINMGMTMGLVPITGLPLPFFSYGGSSLVTSLALVGLVANVTRQRYLF